MNKKLLMLGVALSLSVIATGCSGDKGKQKNGTDGIEVEKVETGGLYYEFGETQFDASTLSIGNISYQAPNVGAIERNNARAFLQSSDKHVLFIWYDEAATCEKAEDVLSTSDITKSLVTDIATDLGIKNVGYTFNVESNAVTTNNPIERYKNEGTLVAHKESDDSEVEYKMIAYTFVANKHPGCVISVVTDAEQSQASYDQAAHNAEVLMNTIVAR